MFLLLLPYRCAFMWHSTNAAEAQSQVSFVIRRRLQDLGKTAANWFETLLTGDKPQLLIVILCRCYGWANWQSHVVRLQNWWLHRVLHLLSGCRRERGFQSPLLITIVVTIEHYWLCFTWGLGMQPGRGGPRLEDTECGAGLLHQCCQFSGPSWVTAEMRNVLGMSECPMIILWKKVI